MDSGKKIFLIVLVFLSLPIIVYSNNHFLNFGSDQSRDIVKAKSIVETGGFMPTDKTSYYDSFPIKSLLMASIFIFNGSTEAHWLVFISVVHLFFTLVLILFSNNVVGDKKSAFLAPFIWMASPALPFLTTKNQVYSIVFSFVALYLVYIWKNQRIRGVTPIIIPFAIAMVASHASGPIFMLSLLLPLSAISLALRDQRSNPNHLGSICILIILITLFYWIFNEFVLLSLMNPTKDLIRTIAEWFGEEQSQIRYAARPYLVSSDVSTVSSAFSWAVPPAFVAGHLIYTFYNKLLRGRQNEGKKGIMDKIELVGSLVGLSLLFAAFLLSHHGTYTYLNTPTYAILLFLMIVILPKLLSSENKLVAMTTVCILGISLFVGSSSPNWAPIENQDFEQRRCLYQNVVSTGHLGYFLPENVTLYLTLDYDVYISIGEHVYAERPGSYRIERREIQLIESGHPINEIADNNSTVFIIRAKRLTLHSTDLFNLVLSTQKHAIVLPLSFDYQTNLQVLEKP